MYSLCRTISHVYPLYHDQSNLVKIVQGCMYISYCHNTMHNIHNYISFISLLMNSDHAVQIIFKWTMFTNFTKINVNLTLYITWNVCCMHYFKYTHNYMRSNNNIECVHIQVNGLYIS